MYVGCVHDCDAVIVGCMNSTSVNYDSHANFPAPCKAKKTGCMASENTVDYAAENTVYAPCKMKVTGCMDPTAANHMAKATFDDGSCAAVRIGCGHPMAYNYDVLVTNHNHLACNWYPPSPPSAPVTYPAGTVLKTAYVVVQVSTYAESPDSFLKADANGKSPLDYICAATKEATGADSASCTVNAGSAIVTIELMFDSQLKSIVGLAIVNGTMPDSMSKVLADYGFEPISSNAVMEERMVYGTDWAIPPSPPPGAGGSSGIVIAVVAVVAVVVAVVLAGVGVYCLRKRSKTFAIQPGA